MVKDPPPGFRARAGRRTELGVVTVSSGRGRRRTVGLLVGLGLALLASVVPGPFGTAPATAGAPHGGPAPTPAAACAGPSVPSAYVGSLIVQGGGASAPSAANRGVSVSYEYELNSTPKGGPSQYYCLNGTASAVTNVYGGFSVSLPITTSSCNPAGCSLYSGPFGPVTFALSAGAPAGFFVTSAVSGSTVALAMVSALDHVDLAPSSRVTLSTNAPTAVAATPRAGNGALSPATTSFAWQLAAVGWTLSNASSPTATIEASVNALPGTLTVWVNGSYAGASVSAPPVTLELAAASTAVTTASVGQTTLDVGTPATFTVIGTGAGGYNYTATVVPGLNAPSVQAPCTGAILEGGRLTLTCSASITYASAGIAAPSATLSNGYSGASASFPQVTVSATLEVSVTPSPLLAYLGSNTTVSVGAGARTGSGPYGPACLWPGDGRVVCVGGAGPSYAIPVRYDYPGAYTARASLADSGGMNLSTTFSALVFALPGLGVVAVGGYAQVGSPLALSSALTGGALPVQYWWNSTDRYGTTTGTLYEGTAISDGPILFSYTPQTSGDSYVSLTIRDALGTTLTQPARVFAAPGPFAFVDDRADSGNGTALAGAAMALSLEAVDISGEPVATAAPSFDLTVAPPAGGTMPVWLNETGAPVAANGTAAPGAVRFPIASTRWHTGWLNLSLTFGGSGLWTLAYPTALAVADAPGGHRSIAVAPDARHLRLSGTASIPAGERSWTANLSVTDRWGDAVPAGSVVVRSDFGGTTTSVATPIRLWSAPGGNASFVLVTFNAVGAGAGTVTLLDLANETLAGPIAIPAAAAPAVVTPYLGVLAAAVGAASVIAFLDHRRSRRRPRPGDGSGETADLSEDELRRIAEGRAHVLARADVEEGRSLEQLAEGFVGRPPTPEELTDWVASLVAEGSLRTVLGADGRSRFVRVGPAPPPLAVELDNRALQEALARRDAAERDDPEDAAMLR